MPVYSPFTAPQFAAHFAICFQIATHGDFVFFHHHGVTMPPLYFLKKQIPILFYIFLSAIFAICFQIATHGNFVFFANSNFCYLLSNSYSSDFNFFTYRATLPGLALRIPVFFAICFQIATHLTLTFLPIELRSPAWHYGFPFFLLFAFK